MIATALTNLSVPERLRVESTAVQALEALLASKTETVVLRAAIGVLNHLERLRRHEARAQKPGTPPAPAAPVHSASDHPPVAPIRLERPASSPPMHTTITPRAPAARLLAVVGGPRAPDRSP